MPGVIIYAFGWRLGGLRILSIPLGILQIEAHTFTIGCLRLTMTTNREA